jgi:DNA-binding HxlR family transcriptional regulator
VEYSLRPLGRTLVKPLVALGSWAEMHQPEIEAANTRYDQKIQKSA